MLMKERISLRFILMYKVVEGLVPSLPPDKFLKFSKPKRKIKAKPFSDHIATNFVNSQVCNNSKGLQIPDSKAIQYRNSFFVDTAIHWNHLPDSVVQKDSVESFKNALQSYRAT
ncbi:hypothetical protein DPMN_185550 [Dreissena polymorpha]|uniref:Uncharacterized protein n=1 Tax=Dreissena polymorpha TaxID=45954 RepID=A0A9D4DNT2_DREPO|nr:hypothetical protein DPMN_185550 [Dreissena polymorpha]